MVTTLPHMNEDILDIRLLPAWSPSHITDDLGAALARADFMQAGVAYWTVNPSIFGQPLAAALRRDDGFLCVDLHPPTDVDALAALVTMGARVFVYYEDIPTYADDGRPEPPCLVHTKMLLFVNTDRTGELWVGSHNWTNRALLGLNVEASLVVRLRDSSPLFISASEYLHRIRSVAEPFDPARIQFYKDTQRRMKNGFNPVIELEAEDAAHLVRSSATIFGTDTRDLKSIGSIRRDIHLLAHDSATGEEFLYAATVVQAGLLSAVSPAARGLSFSPRRYAVRYRRRLAQLKSEGPVPQTVVDNFDYFVNLQIGLRETTRVAVYPPSRSVAWDEDMSDGVSPLLGRLDPAAMKRLFRDREPKVRRPVIVEEQPQPSSLKERRQLPEYPLVSKRLLLPHNLDGG